LDLSIGINQLLTHLPRRTDFQYFQSVVHAGFQCRTGSPSYRSGPIYDQGLIHQFPVLCFHPNQPDPNVLTEVEPPSGFPVLESAGRAAYIGELRPARRKVSAAEQSFGANHSYEAKAERLRFSDCTPFPENEQRSQKFVNAFCKTGVSPAMLSVVWLTPLFQFLFFAESTGTIHRQRNFSGRFGFILLAANSSTTLCSHSTHQLNRAGLADER
jgi:hypothetical protein